jgi:predicted ATPase
VVLGGSRYPDHINDSSPYLKASKLTLNLFKPKSIMRLQRVQIPNFRVLKDIDITFEDYHTPQIFPLASQNGGGKSTFLQLVFTLLNCCNDSSGYKLVENLLKNSGIDHFVTNSKLATITLMNDCNTITLDFEFHSDKSLFENHLIQLSSGKEIHQIEGIKNYEARKLSDFIALLENEIKETNLRIRAERSEVNRLVEISKDPLKTAVLDSQNLDPRKLSIKQQLEVIKLEINDLCHGLIAKTHVLQTSKDSLSEFNNLLADKKIKVISRQNDINLICKVNDNSEDFNFLEVVNKIFEHVFIAAPSSQVFLFLAPEEIHSLFKETSDYYTILKEKQKNIYNMFLYEFSIVKVLTDAFKQAFENDRVLAIKNGGRYGQEFESLFNDLKNFLNGKTIQPSEDMSKIIIKQMDSKNQEIELSPTDLSHGELRRLSFYTWLKTNKIKNSIILVDEIEIGLHPDWQYQIVRDLEEWEPSNQYILATHSYEVCSALSPAHVKEIEPKLLKQEAKTAQ